MADVQDTYQQHAEVYHKSLVPRAQSADLECTTRQGKAQAKVPTTPCQEKQRYFLAVDATVEALKAWVDAASGKKLSVVRIVSEEDDVSDDSEEEAE